MYHSRYLSITWWWPRDKRRRFWYIQSIWSSLARGLLFKLKQNDISGNLSNVITDFFYQMKQRIVFNGQYSSWTNIKAGVPQGSLLETLYFLIYINNLSDDLTSNSKLFGDDTSLFSVIHNIDLAANDLNSDLMKIRNQVFQWKMRFNPNPNKQAQEVISSRKIDKITIFKSFIKPHLDYGDIIYDRAYNTSFHQNIESIQYNAAQFNAITGAVKGTSREKLYQELGFESLQQRRWYRQLCCLFKIINNKSPIYIFQPVPSPNTRYFSLNSEKISQLRAKHDF